MSKATDKAAEKTAVDEQAEQPKGPQPMKVPEGGWPPDEFTGKAGSFVRDRFTGKRSKAG